MAVQVHGVSGGVRGQGRGARAPRLRPRLPRGLHRRLAEATPHLPRLPRLPARQERHPRRAARLQPPRRRRRSEGLRGRRPAGRPRVLLVLPRRVTAGSRTPAPDGRHGCRWPAGDHLRRARLVGRPEPCCCCWRWWWPFSLRGRGEAERRQRRLVRTLLASACLLTHTLGKVRLGRNSVN